MPGYRFSVLIKDSARRTNSLLFRPFRLKKWVLLFIIVALAGQLWGGLNFRLPSRGLGVAEGRIPHLEALPTIPRILLMVGISSLIPIVCLILWINCRFSFMFIGSVIKGDLSIRRPFREYRALGNSLFWWYIGVILTFLIPTALLLRSFAASVNKAWYILWFIPLGLSFFVVRLGMTDFIQPIMYREEDRFLGGWRRFRLVFKSHKPEIVKYILIKFVLLILAFGAFFLISFIIMLGLSLMAMVTSFLIWAVSGLFRLTQPHLMKIFWNLMGTPSIVALFILSYFAFLPIPVFFRFFSLKFIGSLEDRYELWG